MTTSIATPSSLARNNFHTNFHLRGNTTDGLLTGLVDGLLDGIRLDGTRATEILDCTGNINTKQAHLRTGDLAVACCRMSRTNIIKIMQQFCTRLQLQYAKHLPHGMPHNRLRNTRDASIAKQKQLHPGDFVAEQGGNAACCRVSTCSSNIVQHDGIANHRLIAGRHRSRGFSDTYDTPRDLAVALVDHGGPRELVEDHARVVILDLLDRQPDL
mmetsp:Transcript_37501/g.120716  ORF Transcript_37501/g.120716 Transcript_37501/m.120716 type:complete len:214 (+) Transcript_37501:369-1010(+)